MLVFAPMALVLLVTGLSIAGGVLATYAYDADAYPVTRLFSGTLTGLLAFAVVGLGLGLLEGLDLATVFVAALLVALPLIGLARSSVRSRVLVDVAAVRAAVVRVARHPTPRLVGVVAGLCAVGIALWAVFDHVLIETAGGISTGYVNNLGDLPFHLSLITSFAYGANLPPQDPTYAGTALTYPFLADYLSAMLVVAGASLRESIFVPNLLLGSCLVGLMARWTWSLTRSRLAAAIAPVLVLLGGGLGWLMLADDARVSGQGVVAAIINPPHDYTILGDSIWRWGNAITTLLVTQRSLLFGLPVAILIFTLTWRSLHAPAAPGWTGPRSRMLLAAGLLTGPLALVHTHTLVVVLGTSFLQGILFREWRSGRGRGWILYLLGAAALAVPGVLLLTVGSAANVAGFFGFEVGWDHGTTDPVVFWLANTGLFIPLLLIGLLVGRIPWVRQKTIARRRLAMFLVPFLVWFIVPNVLRLAPWIWDNIKVLFYWWVGMAPLVALVLATWWHRSRALGRAVVVGVLISLTLAGSIDIWRAASGQTVYEEYAPDSLALAAAIRDRTQPGALILSAPTWNPTVFLTGRPSLLGYTGYIWAHGLPYTDRERDIEAIYAGTAEALPLLRKYGIDYVELTPVERGWMTGNNESVSDAFFGSLQIVAQSGDYRLYEVPHG
jgi:hypothetical protein